MTMPLIKVCKVKTQDEMIMLHSLGVDIVGLHMIGPECIDSKKINTLARNSRKAIEIGLSVSLVCKDVPFPSLEKFFKEATVDYLQIHNIISSEELGKYKSLAAANDVKLVRLVPYEKCDELVLADDESLMIFDWESGGTGKELEQEVLENLPYDTLSSKCFIAGGLNPNNVGRLIAKLNPLAVDVQSSVRTEDGSTICRDQVYKFCSAVRQYGVTSEPYPKYVDLPWVEISDFSIDKNHTVAQLHLLEILEDLSPYEHAEGSLTLRITKSLAQLRAHKEVSQEWLEAALAAFGATSYFPPRMMDDSLRYLYLVLTRLMKNRHGSDDFHLFVNDPGKLNENFMRVNRLSGRLDNEKYARINGVAELANTILDLHHSVHARAKTAESALKTVASRQTWALLADQTLSGHSLEKDLERLILVQNTFKKVGKTPPIIDVLCQIATETAVTNLFKNKNIKDAFNHCLLTFNEAMYLDDEYNVASTKCSLINEDHLRNLRELCVWFAEEYLVHSEDLKRMREKSGDNLSFGYRKAGLLMYRQENCPTDTLPMLWFSGTGKSGKPYSGPFPRVHSRIGPQSTEPTSDLWESLSKDSKYLQEFAELKK